MEKMVGVALVILSLALHAYSGPVGTQDFHFHESETGQEPCFEEHPENVTVSTEIPDPDQIASTTAIPDGDAPEIQLDYDASKASQAMFEMYDGQTRLLCVIAPPENEVEDAMNDIESLDGLSAVRRAEALRQEQPVNVGNFVVDADESEDGRSDLDSEPEPEPEPEAEPEPCTEPEFIAETETSTAEPDPESGTETVTESLLETSMKPDSGTKFLPVSQESDRGSLSASEKEAMLLPLTGSTEPAPSMVSPETDDGVVESTSDVARDTLIVPSEGSTNSSSASRTDIDDRTDIEPEATNFSTRTTEPSADTTDLPSEIKGPLSGNAFEGVLDADSGTTTNPTADDLKELDNREGNPQSIEPQDSSENINTDQTLRQAESLRDSTNDARIQSDTRNPIESGSEAVETTKIAPIFKRNCNRSSGLRRMTVMA